MQNAWLSRARQKAGRLMEKGAQDRSGERGREMMGRVIGCGWSGGWQGINQAGVGCDASEAGKGERRGAEVNVTGVNFRKREPGEAMEMEEARAVYEDIQDVIELEEARVVYEEILEAIEMEEARRRAENGPIGERMGGGKGANGLRIYWLDAEGNFPGKAELRAAFAAEVERMGSYFRRVLQRFCETGAASVSARPSGNITDFIIGARRAANIGSGEAHGGVLPPAIRESEGDGSIPQGREGRARLLAAASRKRGLKRGAGLRPGLRPAARDGAALSMGLLRGHRQAGFMRRSMRQAGFMARGLRSGGALGKLFKFCLNLLPGRASVRAGLAQAEITKLKLRFMNGGGLGAKAGGGALPKGTEPKILINFNIINARAEEEKINLIKLNSSSSAHTAGRLRSLVRKDAEISSSSSSPSSSSLRHETGREAFRHAAIPPLSSSSPFARPEEPRALKAGPALAITEAEAPLSVEISQAIPCPPAPLKAGNEGGEGDLNAVPQAFADSAPPEGSGKAQEEEEAIESEKSGESPAGGYYSRQGKVFYFANCRGGDEAVSASLVEYWREVFRELDVDRELSGIAVWLKSNHAGGIKGGPMPGRERMEKYVANCLRVAARASALNRPRSRKRSASPQDALAPSRLKELEAIYSRALEASAAGSRK